MAKRKKDNGANSRASQNGAKLGFEEKLWAAADKLRGLMDASDYKHVVLGLIFLKYISDRFLEHYEALSQDKGSLPHLPRELMLYLAAIS